MKINESNRRKKRKQNADKFLHDSKEKSIFKKGISQFKGMFGNKEKNRHDELK